MSSQRSIDQSIARASVATPLALVVFTGATLIGALVAHPSLAEISRDYLTILTPNENWIGIYWLVLSVLLVGGCFRIVLARSEASKLMIANGVGLRLALAITLMAAWTLFWTIQSFVVAEILLLVNLVVVISLYTTLLIYRPSSPSGATATTLDYVFLQAPVRMLLVVLFSVDIWHQGLLAIGWYRYVGSSTSPHHPGKWEGDHAVHSWIAFGVIAGVAIINATNTFLTTDVVWGLSSIYISLALAANAKGKPPQIFVTLLLGAALVAVALASSIVRSDKFPHTAIEELIHGFHLDRGEATTAAVGIIREFVATRAPANSTMPLWGSQAYWEHLYDHPQKSIAWEGPEGIIAGRFLWCEQLGLRTTDKLVHTCKECSRFYLTCCDHTKSKSSPLCHGFQAIYADGAFATGVQGAMAGIGGAFGAKDEQKWSFSVGVGPDGIVPTSQRAELFAALAALRKIDNSSVICHTAIKTLHKPSYVIVTDSEYVVKGVTEYYPKWKFNTLADSLAKKGKTAPSGTPF
ncbi:hypothetical protein RQP46_006375 [Phenoliferia psychrophenolica]